MAATGGQSRDVNPYIGERGDKVAEGHLRLGGLIRACSGELRHRIERRFSFRASLEARIVDRSIAVDESYFKTSQINSFSLDFPSILCGLFTDSDPLPQGGRISPFNGKQP